MRGDQLATFVVIATGQTAVWMPSRNCLFHATVDGLRAVCNRAILVHEDPDALRFVFGEDRSDSVLTCHKCAERVRRVRIEPRDPIDVNAAIRRHAARELGVSVTDLGKWFPS